MNIQMNEFHGIDIHDKKHVLPTEKRMIHKNLKSMNILVKCDKHVCAKVANYGLSKIKESSCTCSY
jgi:hypothetical protein